MKHSDLKAREYGLNGPGVFGTAALSSVMFPATVSLLLVTACQLVLSSVLTLNSVAVLQYGELC